MKKNASINELMGLNGDKAKESGIDFKDLPELLGEQMPVLGFHTLGRVRLIRALRQRFGPNFRAIQGIRELIDKFDHESKVSLDHHILKKKLSQVGR
jgi:hypothetical protein